MTSKANNSILGTEKFNILTHIKFNIRSESKICELHDSDIFAYCNECKFPICEICNITLHMNHNVILKKDFKNNFKNILNSLESFEKEVKDLEAIIQPNVLLNTYKEEVTKEMDDLIEKINYLKKKRLEEISKMNISHSTDFSKLKSIIQIVKNDVNSFYSKNSKILTEEAEENNLFIFLYHYDLSNELKLIFKEYYELFDDVKESYKNFKNFSNFQIKDIIKSIDDLLLEQKKKEIQISNDRIWNNINKHNSINISIGKSNVEEKNNKSVTSVLMPAYSLLSGIEKINVNNFDPFTEKVIRYNSFLDNFRKLVNESVIKTQSLGEINKILKVFEDKLGKKVMGSSESRKINLNKTLKSKLFASVDFSSNSHINSNLNINNSLNKSLANDDYIVIKSKVKELYNASDSEANTYRINEIDENKNDNEEKDNSIESENVLIDKKMMKLNQKVDGNKKSIYKKIEKVFKPKKILNIKEKLIKPKINNINSSKNEFNTISTISTIHHETISSNVNNETNINQENNIKHLMSINHINLSLPQINRLFGFSLFDYLRSLEKKEKGESDFNIFEQTFLKESIYLKSVIKIIEGSDEIHIYTNGKLEKRKVELNPKIFNTKHFYVGCRWIHINDKVYISGGKDFNGDKLLFIQYDLLTNKALKLSDLKYPRSFHTMFYYSTLNSILCIGGENNNSCEMYDFYVTTWNDFPELNINRANTHIIMNDKSNTLCALFGISGNVSNKKFLDSIEILHLSNINSGWYKLDYINKTGIDLKQYELKVKQTHNNKILIYGGVEMRNNSTMYIILDPVTIEMKKLNKNQFELLFDKKDIIEDFSLLNVTNKTNPKTPRIDKLNNTNVSNFKNSNFLLNLDKSGITSPLTARNKIVNKFKK